MLLVALLLGGTVLGSCTDRPNVGPVIDKIPEWAGGLPKGVPPRPGTPEYEAHKKRLEGRDKSDAESQAKNKSTSASK
jgi:hypothetical protein